MSLRRFIKSESERHGRGADKLFQSNPLLFSALPAPIKRDAFKEAQKRAERALMLALVHRRKLERQVAAGGARLSTLDAELADLRRQRAGLAQSTVFKDAPRASYLRYLRA
jgi:hypothetical protein